MYHKLINYSSLNKFGCLVFVASLNISKLILTLEVEKHIFLAHKYGVKGYILFDLHSKQLFVSGDIIYFEHIFPYISFTPLFILSLLII